MTDILIYTIGNSIFIQAAHLISSATVEVLSGKKLLLEKEVSKTDFMKLETGLPGGKYTVRFVEKDYGPEVTKRIELTTGKKWD